MNVINNESSPAPTRQVAYFSMEFAFSQALKTYSGGLGFLAGSHMRSAYSLKQPVVAIGILWKYGYYDQVRKGDQTMDVLFLEKQYSFLQPTHITFQIQVNHAPVWVTAYYLPPTVFGTAPTYFLSTDLPENDYLAQTICHKLYDPNPETRIASSILLGIGGAKLLEKLAITPDVYHMNESHPLPLAFYLYSQWGSREPVKDRLVFTTHTPEEAGNPRTDIRLLDRMGFFNYLDLDEVRRITGITDDQFNWALGALRLAGRANAVSKKHQQVSQAMWQGYDNLAPILSITNAQNNRFWGDPILDTAAATNDDIRLMARKKTRKQRLFDEVADQTGDLYDPNVFTMVWARRFAGYKRADLLLSDPARFERLMTNPRYPIQLIWAGKPYPFDYASIGTFDRLAHVSKQFVNCSVLVGYEIHLSRLLKQGADLWLNTPRLTREASGTSGMTAAMNGALNCSTNDGWIPEFARPGINSFILPEADLSWPTHEQDAFDADNLFTLLETVILPMYYEQSDKWIGMIKASMQDVVPYFDSDRMATEYYEQLYSLPQEAILLAE
ncbi:alpha-glucan family phosphorylase [Spirosoma sp. KCTC 42546]|uniref:alpha-glucan family phosphorylase n=1 Tax=Spirosoma sp. KCTC 42546 TaxID=2520506 RepID=UPI00115AAFEB|nr:alpha-glucan family phosphorylase [Spirosoma sp. KCTC 42546]QDK77492.1 alpha-glucan family phosphorylase [Spirosoma sp. KCTC 42546]